MQSTSQGHGKSTNIKYDTYYYDLLINAGDRYDKTHQANLGKRSNICTIFTQNVENMPGDDQFSPENPWESYLQGIDTPSDKFNNSTTAHLPRPSRHQKITLAPQVTA